MPSKKEKTDKFINEMTKNSTIIENYLKPETKKTAELLEDNLLSINKIDKGMRLYISNFFKNKKIEDYEDIFKKFIVGKSEEEKREIYADAMVKFLNNVLRANGEPCDTSMQSSDDTNEKMEYINDIIERFGSGDSKIASDIKEKSPQVLANNIHSFEFKSFKKVESINKFFNNVKEKFSDYEDFVPSEKEYLTYKELGDAVELPMKDKEIDAIINENKDSLKENELQALNDAKKILVMGDSEVSQVQSNIAEDCGKLSESIEINDSYDKAVNDKTFGENIGKSSMGIMIKDDTPHEEKIEYATKALNAKEDYFTEEEKEKIIALVDHCTKSGIFVLNNEGESGVKTYAFDPLVKLKFELEKAVDEKNVAKIVELQAKYRDFDAKYEKALEMVSELGIKGLFPANVSSSRVESVPYKYRTNFENPSKLNSLLISMKFLNSQNINLKDFLDKPITTFRQVTKDFLSKTKASTIYSEIEDSNAAIYDIMNASSSESIASKEVYMKASGSVYLFQRGFSGLKELVGDYSKRIDFNINFDVVNDVLYSKPLSEETGITTYFKEHDQAVENICNFLFAEKEDRDFRLIACDSEKYFDINENGTITRVGKVGDDKYNMTGIAYFNDTDAKKLYKAITEEFGTQGYENMFWDDVVNKHINEFSLKIFPVEQSQIMEIDTVDELEEVRRRLKNES